MGFSGVESLAWLKFFFSFSLLVVLRLVSVRKTDRIVKVNYLNRIRLREDTSQSRDRMHLLMPDFVVERISNFEVSSRFGLQQRISSAMMLERSVFFSAISAILTR